ncbi:MAG TPA: hypothetical protein VLJ21_02930 [Candidatus Binatia bacterium]|nr:hypothetical protein [Candidatus Binatia bacterium]
MAPSARKIVEMACPKPHSNHHLEIIAVLAFLLLVALVYAGPALLPSGKIVHENPLLLRQALNTTITSRETAARVYSDMVNLPVAASDVRVERHLIEETVYVYRKMALDQNGVLYSINTTQR